MNNGGYHDVADSSLMITITVTVTIAVTIARIVSLV